MAVHTEPHDKTNISEPACRRRAPATGGRFVLDRGPRPPSAPGHPGQCSRRARSQCCPQPGLRRPHWPQRYRGLQQPGCGRSEAWVATSADCPSRLRHDQSRTTSPKAVAASTPVRQARRPANARTDRRRRFRAGIAGRRRDLSRSGQSRFAVGPQEWSWQKLERPGGKALLVVLDSAAGVRVAMLGNAV